MVREDLITCGGNTNIYFTILSGKCGISNCNRQEWWRRLFEGVLALSWWITEKALQGRSVQEERENWSDSRAKQMVILMLPTLQTHWESISAAYASISKARTRSSWTMPLMASIFEQILAPAILARDSIHCVQSYGKTIDSATVTLNCLVIRCTYCRERLFDD